jgi:hypothetical protein
MALSLSFSWWSATVRTNGQAAQAQKPQKEQELQAKKAVPLAFLTHLFLTDHVLDAYYIPK